MRRLFTFVVFFVLLVPALANAVQGSARVQLLAGHDWLLEPEGRLRLVGSEVAPALSLTVAAEHQRLLTARPFHVAWLPTLQADGYLVPAPETEPAELLVVSAHYE